jgi:hypothetical protein
VRTSPTNVSYVEMGATDDYRLTNSIFIVGKIVMQSCARPLTGE